MVGNRMGRLNSPLIKGACIIGHEPYKGRALRPFSKPLLHILVVVFLLGDLGVELHG